MRWGKSAEMMTNADEDEKSSLNQDNVVGVGGIMLRSRGYGYVRV